MEEAGEIFTCMYGANDNGATVCFNPLMEESGGQVAGMERSQNENDTRYHHKAKLSRKMNPFEPTSGEFFVCIRSYNGT